MNFPVWFLYCCVLQWAEQSWEWLWMLLGDKGKRQSVNTESWTSETVAAREGSACVRGAGESGLLRLGPSLERTKRMTVKTFSGVMRQFNSNSLLSSYRQLWVPVPVVADCQSNLQEFPFSCLLPVTPSSSGVMDQPSEMACSVIV